MSGRPTPEQLAEFDHAGFLVIRGFFEGTECTELQRWTEEIAAAPELPGRHMVYYEDSLTEPGRRIVQRIENVCPFHPGFDTLLRRRRLIAWAGALLGGEARARRVHSGGGLAEQLGDVVGGEHRAQRAGRTR